MDKVLSARVDEGVALRLSQLARQLRKTKKAVLEEAILMYSAKVERESQVDPLDVGLGAWQRDELPDDTVRKIRDRSREGWRRYQG